MNIIGAGLPRSGNTSFAKFLARSGLRVVQYAPGTDVGQWWLFYDNVDALVDFPMMLVFPWVMQVLPDCKMVITVRSSFDDMLESLNRHCASVAATSPAEALRQLECVHNVIYGTTTPTVADLRRAQLRVLSAASEYITAGRCMVIDYACPDNVEILTDFLQLQTPCPVYPHEGQIFEQVEQVEQQGADPQ